MSRFMLSWDVNKDRGLCHVINFLIACQITSLEGSLPMFDAFHSREEGVVVDIPDELDSRCREAMDAVNIRFEKI